MFDVLRFWLGRGVDGFRVDTIWLLLEDDQLRDNPVNPNFRPGMLPAFALTWTRTADQPDTHALVRRMRQVFDEYPDRVLVAELLGSLSRLISYYGVTCDETQLPFNFQLFDATWEAPKLAELIATYEAALPTCAWPDWVLGNHDQHRVVTRLGPDLARVAAMLLLTLRGTPTLYYGDELGLPDAVVPPHLAQDPLEKQQPGHGLGRDPERSPMPWDAGSSAGFTSGTPWLPLVADWRTLNVEIALKDPDSLLSLQRRLLALRRSALALAVGSYVGLPSTGTSSRIHATIGRATELSRRTESGQCASRVLGERVGHRRNDRRQHDSRPRRRARRRADPARGARGCHRSSEPLR